MLTMPVETEKFSDVRNIPRLSPESFRYLSITEQLTYLCALGHLAPSSHNTQPWRFFLDPAHLTITISIDKNFILPISDPTGRQAAISTGCALQNMVIGGGYYGYEVTVKNNDVSKDYLSVRQSLPPQSEIIPVAHISFKPGKTGNTKENEELFPSLFDRRVTRAEFDPERPLDASVIHELESFSSSPGVSLHFFTQLEKRQRIAEFQAQADGFVMNSPAFTRELGVWLTSDQCSNGLGMPGSTFGLPAEQAERLHLGLLGKIPLEPEDSLRFALGGKMGMEKSPLIGCITAADDSLSSWLAAGTLFERLFLKLAREGVAIAVHAGIIEVPLIERMFTASFGLTQHPAVLFRAGYAKRPDDLRRPASPRRPLSEVIYGQS